MQSFTSRELVKCQFSWQYYYWYLTNEGIEYLRTYLNLSADVVPNTLKKSTRAPTRPAAGERPPREGGYGGDRGDRGDRPAGDRPRFGGGDRDSYRSGPPREGGEERRPAFGRGGSVPRAA